MDNRKETVEKIINELNGRGGFDDWWGNLDEDIQEEITDCLVNILPIHDVVGSEFCECENPSMKRNGCCRNCGCEIK